MVIMEPVRGGSLAGFSEDINAIFHAEDENASIASYALRWVASHPNVKVVLSGMTTMEQVQDNLHTFEQFRPIEPKEQKMLDQVVAAIRNRMQNGMNIICMEATRRRPSSGRMPSARRESPGIA